MGLTGVCLKLTPAQGLCLLIVCCSLKAVWRDTAGCYSGVWWRRSAWPECFERVTHGGSLERCVCEMLLEERVSLWSRGGLLKMEPCEERRAPHINELIKRPNTLSQLDYEVKLCSSEVSIDMYFHINFLHRHYISHFNAFLAADSTQESKALLLLVQKS